MGLIARSCYGALRAAGVPALRRRLKNAGLILCYHDVVDAAGEAGCPGLHERSERFERQMRWLASQYHIIGLAEFADRLTRGMTMRSVASVTFDDGYEGVFEHAVPVLERFGIPATVFVVADLAGSGSAFPWDGGASYRAAGWRQVRDAQRRGIEIGGHTATHPSLPTLGEAELQREIATSRATIRDATGIWPRFFAYPFGHWDARVRSVVQSAGYTGGLTLDFGLNGPRENQWSLRRVNVPAGISDATFEAWASGCHGLRTH